MNGINSLTLLKSWVYGDYNGSIRIITDYKQPPRRAQKRTWTWKCTEMRNWRGRNPRRKIWMKFDDLTCRRHWFWFFGGATLHHSKFVCHSHCLFRDPGDETQNHQKHQPGALALLCLGRPGSSGVRLGPRSEVGGSAWVPMGPQISPATRQVLHHASVPRTTMCGSPSAMTVAGHMGE